MSSAEEYGPKAESLRVLKRAGLPVPEARFLSTAAYLEHAARAGIAAASGPVAAYDAIVRTPLAPQTAATLRAWYRELGSGLLAVRSSANAEDLPGASFAGQHGTYFVTGEDELLVRVRDCWASLFSARAVAYRERAGIDEEDVAMAVIVQRLVPALAAGVAFTADPVTGAPGVTVEACAGIGEALVSGKVTPDRFVFKRGAAAPAQVIPGDKRVRIAPGADGTVTESLVSADQATSLCISADLAREIVVLSLRAQELFATAVDVEWAFDGEQLWLLQARPITALPAAPQASAASAVIWSNVNTGEILPDVVTPMTWSIIYGRADKIFCGMFGAFGITIDAEKLVGLVGGRVYFNLSLMQDSFRDVPGMDVDIVLGGMQSLVELPHDTGRHRRDWLAPVRLVVALPGYVIRHRPKRAAAFVAVLRATTDDALAQLGRPLSAREAYELFERLVTRFDDFNDSLAFQLVAMLGFGVLGKACGSWLGDESGALATRLVAGRGDVASAEAGHALWRLAATARADAQIAQELVDATSWPVTRTALQRTNAGRRFIGAWDGFMLEHGHHRRGELEFANPTWSERPDYVLGIVRSYLSFGSDDDPMALYAEHSLDADRTAQECRRALRNPLKRMAFERVLGWGRASAHLRENVKSEAVRWLVAVRYSLLALADHLVETGVLESRDDIFFLTYEELGGVVDGSVTEGLPALIAQRRTEHERLSKLSPPPVVIGEWNESQGWDIAPTGQTLSGIAVSPGVVRGPARVFVSVDAHDEVLPGEILVAPFTDPGWTPYFIPAAGIVMDMGGMLSHGSIIAREYGIPAVVNVGPATHIIKTGQLIEVDGDLGEVRILG